MMYANWVLIANICIGLIGLIVGTFLIIRRLSIKKAIIFDLILLTFGIVLREIAS